MNEEMSIDEAIEILKESKVFDVEMLPIYGLNDYTQAIKSILADRESLEKENTEQQEKLNKIKQYVDREVDLLTDTIEDYIDDDREGNKDIIGSFKEEREQWKDIQRIIKNEGKLYFNLEE